MGRWSHLDTDEERLPDGMTRVGYDADTQVYTYRDADGSYWEGAPGVQYGKLFRVQSHAPQLPSITIPDNVDGDEQPQVLHDYYGDDDDDDDDKHSPSNDHDPEKSPTTTITEPKRAKVRRSHYHQNASKRLPSLPDHDGEKETLQASEDSDGDSDSIQKEKDQSQNPMFSTTHRHRQRRTQERENKQEQQGIKRSGTLSRIARYLSRNAGGSNDKMEHEGIMRRGTIGPWKKSRWPTGPGMASVAKEEGEEEIYEKEEVEGLEQQRERFYGRGISSAGSGSKRRGRATTFDQMLASDGRLLKRAG